MDQNGTTLTPAIAQGPRRRTPWVVALGVLAVGGGLAGCGGGALAATAPQSAVAVAPAAAAPADAAAPAGYTAEQYDAFWGAGYTAADADALAELWGTDTTTAKSRAGQALLDGSTVPVRPGDHPDAPVSDADQEWTAFQESDYTYDDAVALAALWSVDAADAKARIGRAVLDGQALPIAPGSAPEAPPVPVPSRPGSEPTR